MANVSSSNGDETIDGVYYPPPGVFFRLHHVFTDQCFYARDHQSPYTGLVWRSSEVYSDQYFQIEPYRVHGVTRWTLKNKRTGNYLITGSTEDDWITQTPERSDKCGLRLRKGKGKKDQFMISFENSSPIPNACMKANYEGAFTWGDDETVEGMYWEFIFEPGMTIEHVKYAVDRAEILEQVPELIQNLTYRNGGPIQQETKFWYDKGLEHTSEFTWGFGLKIMSEVKGKVGIPSVAEGEVRAGWEANINFSWTETDKTIVTYKAEYPYHIPPYSIIRATALVQTGKLKVPFTVTYVTENNIKLTSGGVWSGVSSWNTSVDFTVIGKIDPGVNDKAAESV